MQPRVLIVQTFYPEFLKDIYAAEPDLAARDFDEQRTRLFASAFGTGDAYSHGLNELGCFATEIICNADAAQARWASEHGLSLHGNIHDQRRQIVAAQIDEVRPDVLYVFEWCPLGDRFLSEMQSLVRLVVGEISSPLPANRTYAGYHLMISSMPSLVAHFRGEGIAAEHVRLGFDGRIVRRLKEQPPRYPATFVGGFAPSHPDRIPWLEAMLEEIDIDIFCYGLEHTSSNSSIRRHHRGQVWGWKMYETLQASRLTLNRHAPIGVGGLVNTDWPVNMRMYEATGVGTCLITERRPRLRELFEPDREVVTYGDTEECVEKIRYYLTHEDERAAIARAGQRRTLGEHLYTHRMCELLDLFRAHLSRTKRRANASLAQESLAHH